MMISMVTDGGSQGGKKGELSNAVKPRAETKQVNAEPVSKLLETGLTDTPPVQETPAKKVMAKEKVAVDTAKHAEHDSLQKFASAKPAGDSARSGNYDKTSASTEKQGMVSGLDIPQSYSSAIMQQLARHKHYPGRARRAGTEGTALVKFRLLPDGRLEGVNILRSTNSAELDRAVYKMFERALPFPKPDFGSKEPSVMEFTIPVSFKIKA